MATELHQIFLQFYLKSRILLNLIEIPSNFSNIISKVFLEISDFSETSSISKFTQNSLIITRFLKVTQNFFDNVVLEKNFVTLPAKKLDQ